MKKISVKLTTASSCALEDRTLRHEFDLLVASFARGRAEHRVLSNGLTLLRHGRLRAVGILSRNVLTVHGIYSSEQLERAVRALPPDHIEEYRIKEVLRGNETYFENPPRKLRKPRLSKKFRTEVNDLFGKKAGELVILYILSHGAQGWIEIVNFLAANIKWKQVLEAFIIN